MKIVVISRNQVEYVQPMKAALSINPLFVFDRTPNHPIDVDFIENTQGEGFLAGRMRDMGAELFPDEDILFLDGDKIPQGDIVADIERLKDKYDCITYGIDPELEDRYVRSHMKEIDSDGILPSHLNNSLLTCGCYSCGMWLSAEAIKKLKELNDGRIFHSMFDGNWGDEDNFLGDQLKYLGMRVGYSTHVRLSGEFSKFEGERVLIYAKSLEKRLNFLFNNNIIDINKRIKAGT